MILGREFVSGRNEGVVPKVYSVGKGESQRGRVLHKQVGEDCLI